jgi:ribosomal protein L34E
MSDFNKEYEEHLRCPNCNRKTEGIDDFKSLIAGSTHIKKTCQKCRKEAYQSFRKKHPPKEKEVIDYNKEYEEHMRCKNCNRKTNGIDDFKNIKTGNIVKTCINCRKSVYTSIKRSNKIPKTYKNTEKINDLLLLISKIDKDILNNALTNTNNSDRLRQIIVL